MQLFDACSCALQNARAGATPRATKNKINIAKTTRSEPNAETPRLPQKGDAGRSERHAGTSEQHASRCEHNAGNTRARCEPQRVNPAVDELQPTFGVRPLGRSRN